MRFDAAWICKAEPYVRERQVSSFEGEARGQGRNHRGRDRKTARSRAGSGRPRGSLALRGRRHRLEFRPPRRLRRTGPRALPRFNEKSLCRLGEGLAQTGTIAPENFRRTVEAVRRFRAIADAMGVKRLDATATEAMRRASNGADLAAAITAESGLAIRILSGAEEARYAALGVISGFFRPVGLVGDMGGGSLEVAEAWTITSASVGSACRSAPCRSRPCSKKASITPSAASMRCWPTACRPR